MIKFIHPDGSHCCRALHSVHAVFFNYNNILTIRTDQPDGRWQEFEIKSSSCWSPAASTTDGAPGGRYPVRMG